MKNKYIFFIIFLMGLLLGSCAETGLEGPEGPAGPQGKPGEAGPVGAAGKDGSIMYSGNGAPASSLGNNGDYYLDKTTGNLYGPKLAGAWSAPIALRGANGADGANGTSTLSGAGSPSISMGINGDYYLDKTNYLLYGPKTASGWGSPILLKGADGTQGPAGPAGKDGSIIYSGTGLPDPVIGANGDYYLDKTTGNLYGPKVNGSWGAPTILKGTNGTNGSVTLSGNGAPISTIGANGDYYLDKTNYMLYGPKTANDWGVPILLRGANGAQGPTGPAGADGTIIYSGETAPDPILGKTGDFYISRLPLMLYGPKSALMGWGIGTSLKGTDGTNGNTILNGTGAPAAGLGQDGDFYIDISTYTIYGPKTGGTNWGPGTSLKGADGAGNSGLLFETPDNATFSWGYESSYYNDLSKLMMHRNGNYNDSTSVFQVPASAVATAQNSLMLVYMRDATNGWKQVVDGDTTLVGFYTKTRILPGSASARIIERKNGTFIAPNINKVRLVLVPYTHGGVISGRGNNTPIMPLNQALKKLNLQEKDFRKL